MQLRVPCQNLVVAEQDGCLGVNRGILPFPGCWERLAVSLALALVFDQRPNERFPSCIFECRHKTHLLGHENRGRRANGSPLKALLLFIFRSPFDGGGSPLCRSPHRRLPQRSPQTYASITRDHQLGLHQRPGAGQPASALLLSYGGVLPVFPGCRLHLRRFGWPSRTASRPFCAVPGATWVASLRITSNLHGYENYPPRAEPGHDPGISSCTLATYPLVHQPYHFGGVTKMMADKPPAIIR